MQAPASTFSDAEATNELPRSKETVDRLPGRARADATAEITVDDVIDVIDVISVERSSVNGKTGPKPVLTSVPDASMSAVFGAITPKKLRELTGALRASPAALDPTAPPAPPPPPSPLSLVTNVPDLHVASMAASGAERPPSYASEAVVYDIPAPMVPVATSSVPGRPLLESTTELRWFAGVPQRTPWQHVVAGFAGAIALSIGALVLVGSVVASAPGQPQTQVRAATTDSASTVAAAAIEIAPPAAMQGVSVAPVQVAPEPAVTVLQTIKEPSVDSTSHALDHSSASPIPSHVAGGAGATAVTTKPRPKVGVVKTGQVTLPSGVGGALVDGAPKKAVNGSLVLACGPHKVKVAGRPAKTVRVPCDGTTSY